MRPSAQPPPKKKKKRKRGRSALYAFTSKMADNTEKKGHHRGGDWRKKRRRGKKKASCDRRLDLFTALTKESRTSLCGRRREKTNKIMINCYRSQNWGERKKGTVKREYIKPSSQLRRLWYRPREGKKKGGGEESFTLGL